MKYVKWQFMKAAILDLPSDITSEEIKLLYHLKKHTLFIASNLTFLLITDQYTATYILLNTFT